MSIIANTSLMFYFTTIITLIIIARVDAVRSSVAGCPSVTLRETSYLCR